MLIVIPVGPSDATNLHLLTQSITRLGVVEAPILIVSVPSLQADAVSAGAALNATVAITDDEFANGWPVGPDRMFIWTIRYLAQISNQQPWLWLEPDACPLKEDWDVTLRNEYHAAQKPYFGFVRPTAWRDKDGNLTPVEGDNMMAGVAIYPPNMHLDAELAPLLNDLSLADPRFHPPVPWDLYLRWIFARRGVHATNVIYDRWRTCNYTRGEFDVIQCEPSPTEKHAVGGVIPEEAVIVHGCKDGSLHKLIIGPVVEIQSKAFVESVIKVQERVVWTKSSGEKLTVKQEEHDFPVKAIEIVKGSVLQAMSATVGQRVLDALNKLDQPRLSSVVELSKLDKETVKKILPTLGYEVLHAGWIRKTATK